MIWLFLGYSEVSVQRIDILLSWHYVCAIRWIHYDCRSAWNECWYRTRTKVTNPWVKKGENVPKGQSNCIATPR